MGILIRNISLLRSCPTGGQEFGDGVPVSRQQHPCACKRSPKTMMWSAH